MTGENYERVREVFLQALDLPKNERDDFVQDQFPAEPELVEEVLRMLEGHEQTSGFLNPPDVNKIVTAFRGGDFDFSGKSCGEFLLEHEIGRGGMGVVYRAVQQSLERTVAVKLMPLSLTVTDLAMERFWREARAASKLHHPGIASVISFGQNEDLGVLYYAMEYVEGRSLLEVLQDLRSGAWDGASRPGEPDWSDPLACAGFSAMLCDALAFAHGKRVLHRDVKPSNILVDSSGEPHLIDFGLARDLSLDGLTRTGEHAGTPQYMSPEQARAAVKDIDHRSDIYSLGAVLYEVLTLRPTFDTKDPDQLFDKIKHHNPTHVRAINDRVPAGLETVCHKALEKRRGDRYAKADLFAEDLRRVARGEPPLGRRPGRLVRILRRMREHRREVSVTAISVLAIVASWLTFQSIAHEGDPRLTVLPVDSRFEMILFTVDPRTDLPLSRRSLGSAPLRNRRLDPGTYSLLALLPDGSFASAQLEAQKGREEASMTLHPERARDAAAEMIAIQGGTSARPRKIMPGGTHDLPARQVAPFLIDPFPVTNGEYQAFLAARPELGKRPSFWPREDSDAWRDRPEDFDRRPVTGIRIEEARSYARWRGKRLPTLDEWELCMRTEAMHRFPWGEEPGDLYERTPIAREHRPGRDPSSPLDNWENYNHHVRAVDRPDSNPEVQGVRDCYGNTWEMTNTRLWEPSESGVAEPSLDLFVGKGGCWNMALSGLRPQDHGLDSPIVCFRNVPDPTIGFRCARSQSFPQVMR